jgi:hypothetical protein
LSFGDERGYTETVNSPEYAGNLFLALLITGLRGRGVDASYYLFVRGMEGCLRLKESQISYTAHEHLLEPVLREIQGLAVRAQAKLGDRRATRSAPEPIIADGAPDPLRQARTEDSEWLQRRFPGVVTLRDTRTGAIGWKWHSGGADGLMFRYEHPPEGSSGAHARLRLFRDGQLLADHQVPVDATRFAVIEARVGDARQLPGNAVVSGCDAADGEERLKGASEAAEGGERSCP